MGHMGLTLWALTTMIPPVVQVNTSF